MTPDEHVVVGVDGEFPGAAGFAAGLEGEARGFAEFHGAAQEADADFVARLGGKDVSLKVNDGAAAGHAAAGAPEHPIGISAAGEIGEAFVHGRKGGDLALPFHGQVPDADDRGGGVLELERHKDGDDLAGADGLDAVGAVGSGKDDFGAGGNDTKHGGESGKEEAFQGETNFGAWGQPGARRGRGGRRRKGDLSKPPGGGTANSEGLRERDDPAPPADFPRRFRHMGRMPMPRSEGLEVGEGLGDLGGDVGAFVFDVVVLDAGFFRGAQDRGKIELAGAKGDVVFDGGLPGRVADDAFFKIFQMDEFDAGTVAPEEFGGVLAGEEGPEEVELDAEVFRVGHGKEDVEERAFAVGNEFVAVVVIAEREAVFLAEFFADPVELPGGLFGVGEGEGLTVGDPGHADEFRAEGLGVGGDGRGISERLRVANAEAGADHAASVEEQAEFGGGFAEEVGELHVGDAERADDIEGAGEVFLELVTVGVGDHAGSLREERGGGERSGGSGREERGVGEEARDHGGWD